MKQPTAQFGPATAVGVVAVAVLLAVLAASSPFSTGHVVKAQPAPLDPENLILVHVSPSGEDYLGNPYCLDDGQPEVIEPDGVDDDGDAFVDVDADTNPDPDEQDLVDRAVDDCNNALGQDHVIRTRGWDPVTMTVDTWILQNGPPGAEANAAILALGPCGVLPEVTDRPKWDAAQSPPLLSRDDEQCAIIKSILPGETVVHLTFDWDPDGTGPEPTTSFTADPIVKEWDTIVDTAILRAEPGDQDGDTDIDADDHHIADVQGTTEDDGVVFDEALKRMRSPYPVQIAEIVHGEHVSQASGSPVLVHHPTEAAVITATIDSPRGCTYFTNPLLEYDLDEDGVIDVTVPPDEYDFGDAAVGFSDREGRFVGPADHNGSAPGADPVTGDPWAIRDLWLDTFCEEQTTVTITVDYPSVIGSAPQLPPPELLTINWVTFEAAKQPQVRWAGEEIVLAHRWALPDDHFPNVLPSGTFAPICPNAFKITRYNRLSMSTGALLGGVPDIFGLFSEVNQIWTIIDPWCDSRAIASSEDQGEGDFEASVHAWTVAEGPFAGMDNLDALNMTQDRLDELNALLATGDISQESALAEMGLFFNDLVSGGLETDLDLYNISSLENKHAWLVWWLKIYQVKLANILLDQDVGRELHNAGLWYGQDPMTSEGAANEVLNVSQDALLRVTVKGWFSTDGYPSSRSSVCTDMDGDGDGAGSEPGAPYPAEPGGGCSDASDELLAAGHWVLPDDLPALAGPAPERIPTWDVMRDIDEAPSPILLIGPKSSLDSHDPVGDPIARQWVPCLDSTLDAEVLPPPHPLGVDTCPRKSIDPDGEITAADALMPPLKIRASIADDGDGVAEAGEAGFLKGADKDAEVGIESAHQSIMVPADPDIPPIVGNGGYDWDSWACRLPWVSSVFVEYPDDWLLPPDADADPDIVQVCPGVSTGLEQGPYEFYGVLSKTTTPEGLTRSMQLYTDNRGQGFFFANGDYNLTFDECRQDELTGTPVCKTGDVLGTSEITVIGDYPYFRRHSAVLSNPATKTWLWGGFETLTAESIDVNHTAIIAHLKDRDGFCKWNVDIDGDTGDIDVVYSPSVNPVQHEEIEFIVNNSGLVSIVDVSPSALFNAPHVPLGEATVIGAQDGVLIDLSQAVALAEDVRVLDGMEANGMVSAGFGGRASIEEDECQAWVIVEHPQGVEPDVSVVFDNPEGQITRHWPPRTFTLHLVQNWNDACYTGPEQPVEDAVADLLVDSDANTVIDLLAVYRLDSESQAWLRYFPEYPALSDLLVVNPYDQLFIVMEAGADWTIDITNPPGSVSLVEGWNSVCYAGSTRSADDALAGIQGDFAALYALASDQQWRRYLPGVAWATNIVTLDQFVSVSLLVTASGGTTWLFDAPAVPGSLSSAAPEATAQFESDEASGGASGVVDVCAPVFPGTYYGAITVGGTPAWDGTVVRASIGGVEWGSAVTSGGLYVVDVPSMMPASSPCLFDTWGPVTFTADGGACDQSPTWNSGPHQMDLSCAEVATRVRAGSGQAAPGGQVTVPLEAISVPAPGLGAFTVDIAYEAGVVAPVSYLGDPGGHFDTVLCNLNYAPGIVRCSGIRTTPGATGDLALAEVTFDVAPDVPLGHRSPLVVTVQTLADSDGQAIPHGARDGSILVGFTCSDADADGICDNVDLDPLEISTAFSDQGLGGTSFGEVLSSGGLAVLVSDEPNPGGLRIVAVGSGGPATVHVCGIATLELDSGDDIRISCGSATIAVLSGPVAATFGPLRAILPTDTTATVVELAPGAFEVTNAAGSGAPITVNGVQIPPGSSETDEDGDGFFTSVEQHVGTDPLDACPDDPGDDAWPLDVNQDKEIHVVTDVLNFRDRIGATAGAPNWWQRLDFNADGLISVVGDVLMYRDRIGEICT